MMADNIEAAKATECHVHSALEPSTYEALRTDPNDRFSVPLKRISNLDDISFFLSSEAYVRLLNFIERVNKSVLGKTISEVEVLNEVSGGVFLQKLRQILSMMKVWVQDFPPVAQPARFGNMAFRKWIERLYAESEHLLTQLLPENYKMAIIELTFYFKGSFGNPVRIDYGTGHELSFVAFLTCIEQLELFRKDDSSTYAYIGLVLFGDYLSLIRQLQSIYMLEPAGSHGVWGLDDYQFMPFFWGSSQLIRHPKLNPSSIMLDDIVEKYACDFLYFDAIRFIKSLKRGPFQEHSPMLYDISGVSTWETVNRGLKKMFIAEILKKTPIMQHFGFGKLLPYEPATSNIGFEL